MDSQASYPILSKDLQIVNEILHPAFERTDRGALRSQKLFLMSELILIFGAVAAVTLGTISAEKSSSNLMAGEDAGNIWAVAEIFLTFALGSLAFVIRRFRWHERWLRQRTVAETLRGERFLYLGRVGVYADANDPRRTLGSRVIEIEQQGIGI